MAKAVKKKRPGIPKVAVPGKAKRKERPGKPYRSVDYVAIGGDVSMSSIALAGIAVTKGGNVRAGAISVRWEKDTDYFARMAQAAKANEIMYDLFAKLKIMPELDQVYLAVEEPVPIGMFQRSSRGQKSGMSSAYLKQQCQISGAFLGGLLKWGWTQIFEIQANSWRKVVADDLAQHFGIDFTIAPQKFNSTDVLPLPKEFHPNPKSIGKYRSPQWLQVMHPKWDKGWPDIVNHSKRGQIPRPKESKAQGIQPDDRYDAFPMAEWMKREIERSK